jgi:hypothetical protein
MRKALSIFLIGFAMRKALSICARLGKVFGASSLFYIPDSACREAELARNVLFENGSAFVPHIPP